MHDFPEFCVLSCSSEYDDALDHILKESPSLVLYDFDQKRSSIKDCRIVSDLKTYLEELPELIGLSKTKASAYQAIKNDFSDFLLKPVSQREIRKTLMKFLKNTRGNELDRLCIKSYSDYTFLNIKDILFFEADSNTTDIILEDGRKVSAYKTLKHFEEVLSPPFVRVHHSYIVNTDKVVRINFGRSLLYLTNHKYQIPFSKSYKSQVSQLKKEIVNSLSLVS